MEYKTGTLVEFRSRPWVVQQSSDKDLLVIKPLGGTDAETIGLYKPLYGDKLDATVNSYNFRKPSPEDVGANSYPEAARILYNRFVTLLDHFNAWDDFHLNLAPTKWYL